MSEIAELAGVRRPVVTTWRRRHAGFPSAIGGDQHRPLFDAYDVLEWLVATGRAERRHIEPDLRLYALEDLASAIEPDRLLASVTALICLRHLDGEPLVPDGMPTKRTIANLRERAKEQDPRDEWLLSEIRAVPVNAAYLPGVVDELVEAAWGCREAFERFLAARDRLGIRALAVEAMSAELVRLIAHVSGVRERAEEQGDVRLAEAPAGAGDLLTALVGALPEYAAPVVTAAEPTSGLARLLRRRLLVHGIAVSDFEVHVAPDLPYETPPIDVLVTRLPYRPTEDRGEEKALDRIGWIADGLAPGATAVVLGAATALVGPLSPHAPADRMRRDILAAGVVEAVINLPGGLLTYRPGHQTALWVLRRERPSPWQGRVLLADVSDRPLTSDVVDELAADVLTWRREGFDPRWHSRRFALQVALEQVLVPGRALITRPRPTVRDLAERAPARVVHAMELEAELGRVADQAHAQRRPIRSGLAVRQGPLLGTATIGALIQQGWVLLLPGTRLRDMDITTDGHYPVIGSPEVSGESRIGARRIDRFVHANYPRGHLTEPGDVIVTTTPRLGVYVDHAGNSVVGFPARVLRTRPEGRGQLTPRVLAAMLAAYGETRAPRPTGAVRSAQRLLEYEIRLLPIDEVERLDALLADLEERRRLAQAAIDTLDDLQGIVVGGIADGTLTLASAG